MNYYNIINYNYNIIILLYEIKINVFILRKKIINNTYQR